MCLVSDEHQLDLDYFQYIINQEVFILTSLSTIFEVPNDILDTLLNLQRKVHAGMEMFDSIAEEAEGVHVPETQCSPTSAVVETVQINSQTRCH